MGILRAILTAGASVGHRMQIFDIERPLSQIHCCRNPSPRGELFIHPKGCPKKNADFHRGYGLGCRSTGLGWSGRALRGGNKAVNKTHGTGDVLCAADVLLDSMGCLPPPCRGVARLEVFPTHLHQPAFSVNPQRSTLS